MPPCCRCCAAVQVERPYSCHGSTKQPVARIAAACVLLSMVGAACSTGIAPEELVEDWFVSYESGDAAGYQSVMSPDMTFLCVSCTYDRGVTTYFEPVGGAEQDVRDSRLLALGDGKLNPVCDSDGAVVTCATERISAFGFFTDEGEPTQTDRATYEFTISGETISHLTARLPRQATSSTTARFRTTAFGLKTATPTCTTTCSS